MIPNCYKKSEALKFLYDKIEGYNKTINILNKLSEIAPDIKLEPYIDEGNPKHKWFSNKLFYRDDLELSVSIECGIPFYMPSLIIKTKQLGVVIYNADSYAFRLIKENYRTVKINNYDRHLSKIHNVYRKTINSTIDKWIIKYVEGEFHSTINSKMFSKDSYLSDGLKAYLAIS